MFSRGRGRSPGLGGILSGQKVVGTNVNLGPVSHGIDFVFSSLGKVFGGGGDAIDRGTEAVTGAEVVEHEELSARFRSFDWPRHFTNAPNSVVSDTPGDG